MRHAVKFGQQVTIVRPPAAPDRHGDPPPGAATEVTVPAAVYPRTTERGGNENTDMRDTVVTGLVAYLSAGAQVDADDKVRYPVGSTALYEVDGEPARWVSAATGREDLVELNLRRVAG